MNTPTRWILAVALSVVPLLACRGGDEPVELRWLAATEGSVAPPVVGGDIPQYTPPPYVDLSRLEAVMRGNAVPESPDFLVGTSWRGRDLPPGEPRGLLFLQNMMTVMQRDGRTTTVNVDYSGVHPRCHGYPLCIATLNTNGALSINFVHVQGDRLRFAECMDFSPNPPISDEQLAEAGAMRVWDRESVVCFVYNNAATYTPDYDTADDTDDEPTPLDPLDPAQSATGSPFDPAPAAGSGMPSEGSAE